MLSKSFAITPYAMMARPVAGVRHKSIIITIPGSPKAARENLQSIISLMPHACDLAAGASSRGLHVERATANSGNLPLGDQARQSEIAKIDVDSPGKINHHQSHSHTHHDGGHRPPKPHITSKQRQLLSNQLNVSVSDRQRKSPFPMLTVQEALQHIKAHALNKDVIVLPVNDQLVGYVAATSILAAEDVPNYRASIVDGYAVKTSDGPGEYTVASSARAATSEASIMSSNEVVRITTGAQVPEGADAVTMVEDTLVASKDESSGEEKTVKILAQMEAGENIRTVGSDCSKGTTVLLKNEEITFAGGEIGLLVSTGVQHAMVYQKPIVGVLSTGNEIVDIGREIKLGRGEVYDTNRPCLLSCIRAWGFEAVDLGIAVDRSVYVALGDILIFCSLSDLRESLSSAISTVDYIITTGGVSMGEYDLLKPTIERELGGTIHFGRVAMKPGKPTTFATIPSTNSDKQTLLFALPGNPASALVTFHLFVLPALRKSAGHYPHELPRVKARIVSDMVLDPRPEYHRVILSMDAGGILTAASTGPQRSSTVGSMKKANALLCLPAKTDDFPGPLKAGTIVEAIQLNRIV